MAIVCGNALQSGKMEQHNIKVCGSQSGSGGEMASGRYSKNSIKRKMPEIVHVACVPVGSRDQKRKVSAFIVNVYCCLK